MPSLRAFSRPALLAALLLGTVVLSANLLLASASPVGALRASPLPHDASASWQAKTLNHAGLIIRDGEGRVTYAWVPFAEEEIDGIALLRGSGIPVVTVGFGALGEGVCSIAGEGCGVAECRRTVCQASAADAPYWQYFRQDPSDPADWEWQALGASASKVHDGDVFAWSWTAAEPSLPALSAAEIARLAGAGDGEGSAPAMRTLLPQGVAAIAAASAPEARTTAAASAILVAIGAAALLLARRRIEEAAA
jgi:hypothetical protein